MKKNKKFILFVSLFIFSYKTLAKILIPDELQLESEIKTKEKILHAKKNKDSTNDIKHNNGDGIIHYSGDEILMLQKENTLELKGNVFIQRDLITISSEKGVIFFSKNNEPEKIELKGTVHISKKEIQKKSQLDAFSNIAIFYPKEKKISLLGNAIIKRLNDTLEGDILHYNIETEEMSGKQIKGFLSSLEKTKEKKGIPNARSD